MHEPYTQPLQTSKQGGMETHGGAGKGGVKRIEDGPVPCQRRQYLATFVRVRLFSPAGSALAL